MHTIDFRTADNPTGRFLQNIEGAASGAGVSLIFQDTDVDGSGPYLLEGPKAAFG